MQCCSYTYLIQISTSIDSNISALSNPVHTHKQYIQTALIFEKVRYYILLINISPKFYNC